MIPQIEELTSEQESVLERNIVWVFGSRRSGSTWLAKQMLSFRTKYIHEPDITTHLAVMANQASQDFVRKIDVSKNSQNYFFSETYRDTWQYYLKKLILNRIYAQIRDISATTIIKEPTTELDVSDIIAASMKKSKVIILLRDGRDIIDSFIDARQKGGWLAKYAASVIRPEQRMSFIERRAKLWVKQTETLMKTYENHPEELRFLVRYEDLRTNTIEILRKIYALLKIDISDSNLQELVKKYTFENLAVELKGKGKFYRSASLGEWKDNFSEKEKTLMEQIMGSYLLKLGYQIN